MNNLRIKKGDQVKTPHGTGEVKYVYYSSGSCKPYSAQVLVGCDIYRVYFSGDGEDVMSHTKHNKEDFTPICEYKEIKIEKDFVKSAWLIFFGVVTIGLAIGHLFYLWLGL